MDTIYYQSLAAEIRRHRYDGIQKLVITSSGPGEGKSTITANLGRTLAQSKRENVVIVDTDQINPTLHRKFKVHNARGLGEILRDVYQIDMSKVDRSRLGIGDWIELLRVQASTGRLVLNGNGVQLVVEFQEGKISRIEWPERPEAQRIGSLLSRRKIITSAKKAKALTMQRKTHERFGEILCRLGDLEPTDLEKVLRFQFKDCISLMLSMKAPDIHFVDEAGPEYQVEIRKSDVVNDSIMAPFKINRYQPFLSSEVPSYLEDTQITNLKILTSGAAFYDLQDPLVAEQFSALLNVLARSFDLVLIDSPPVAIASPATSVASLADGVLLVVKSDGLDLRIIQQAKEELEKVNANLLGVILNQVDLSENSYLSYYYGAYGG
ncbi:MAG: DUF4388 domain-containing protein [Verrucomicrobiales bacterium]|nr:hypothetical protein [Nitrospinaceae bacterium]